jgi:hypothetical protein
MSYQCNPSFDLPHPAGARRQASDDAIYSQSRAGRWRSSGAHYLQQVRGRLRSFRRGSKRYQQKIKPAPEDVLRSTADPNSQPLPRSDEPVFTAAAASALPDEQAAVNDLLRLIREGGAGFVHDSKPSDILQLYGENVNSLSLYDPDEKWKTTRLHRQLQRYQCDGALLLETGTDFRKLPEEKSLDLLLGDSDCRVTTANNVTEPSGRTQHGGVASLLFPRLAGFCIDSGCDPTGLGRYLWTTVGTTDRIRLGL